MAAIDAALSGLESSSPLTPGAFAAGLRFYRPFGPGILVLFFGQLRTRCLDILIGPSATNYIRQLRYGCTHPSATADGTDSFAAFALCRGRRTRADSVLFFLLAVLGHKLAERFAGGADVRREQFAGAIDLALAAQREEHVVLFAGAL